jgi:hypothetical protein
MVFRQNAAPAGWTKDTASTLNDHALRIVTSTAWSDGSKGTDAFSTTFSAAKTTDNHTLDATELPAMSHSHTIAGYGGGGTGGGLTRPNSNNGESPVGTGSQSVGTGPGGHNHTIVMDVNYANVILASKD